MKRYRTDHRLWALISLAVAIPLGFVDFNPGKGDDSFWGAIGDVAFKRGFDQSDASIAIFMLIPMLLISVPAGWLIQAIALVCGFRRSRTAEQPQSADYDDAARPLNLGKWDGRRSKLPHVGDQVL